MTADRLFDEWTTYEKIVANNYMHHQEFFATLMQEVRVRLAEPLSIIDVGCGDCACVLPLLRDIGINSYTGMDLSETALARARVNLEAASAPYALRCGTMIEELRRTESEVSLVIASFSLHHLERHDKGQVLEECLRLLRPGGMLAVIDVFLEEGESRQGYYERWEENARRSFNALEVAEMEELLAHVRACDIPETLSAYEELGRAAGFERVIPVARDAERLNRLVILTRRGDQIGTSG